MPKSSDPTHGDLDSSSRAPSPQHALRLIYFKADEVTVYYGLMEYGNLLCLIGLKEIPDLLEECNIKFCRSNRWLQHGIVVRADEHHNVALVMRVDVNAELVRNLTDCYLIGSGLDTVQSPENPWHCKGEHPSAF
jgi:hypothetical protein